MSAGPRRSLPMRARSGTGLPAPPAPAGRRGSALPTGVAPPPSFVAPGMPPPAPAPRDLQIRRPPRDVKPDHRRTRERVCPTASVNRERMSTRPRVLLADDHAMLLEAFTRIHHAAELEGEIEIEGEAAHFVSEAGTGVPGLVRLQVDALLLEAAGDPRVLRVPPLQPHRNLADATVDPLDMSHVNLTHVQQHRQVFRQGPVDLQPDQWHRSADADLLIDVSRDRIA